MVQLSWNCMEKPQQENATGLHTWSASLKVLLSNDMKVLAQESIRAGRKTDGYTCIHVIHVSGGTRFSTNTNCIACCCMYHWDMMTATTTACAWKLYDEPQEALHPITWFLAGNEYFYVLAKAAKIYNGIIRSEQCCG